MSSSIKCLVALGGLFILTSCTTGRIPNYLAPSSSEPRALAKFEYDSRHPISTGRILSFDGAFMCDQNLPNSQKLFQRGRGNPLIADLNTEGTWIFAGKIIKLHGYAVTSVTALCETAGSFTPKADADYIIRLVQTGEKSCTLEVLNSESRTLADGFTPIVCEKNR